MSEPRLWPGGEPVLPLWELVQTYFVVARGFAEVFGAPVSYGLTDDEAAELTRLVRDVLDPR